MELHYYKFQDKKTVSVLFPKWEDMFADGLATHKKSVAPMVWLDLELDGKPLKVPVIYWEDVRVDLVRLAVSGDIVDEVIFEVDGGVFGGGVRPLQEPVSVDLVEEVGGRYLKIGSLEADIDIPPAPKDLNSREGVQWYTKLIKDIYSVDGMPPGRYFGPVAYPIQHGYIVPKDSNGKEMRFLGQLAAVEFGLADFMYYLFYSEDAGQFAQFMQMT